MTIGLVPLLRFTWTRTFSTMQGRRRHELHTRLKSMCALFLTVSYLITYKHTLRDNAKNVHAPFLLFFLGRSPILESYVCKMMGRSGKEDVRGGFEGMTRGGIWNSGVFAFCVLYSYLCLGIQLLYFYCVVRVGVLCMCVVVFICHCVCMSWIRGGLYLTA